VLGSNDSSPPVAPGSAGPADLTNVILRTAQIKTSAILRSSPQAHVTFREASPQQPIAKNANFKKIM
jgi:hypothetical protein